MVYDSIEIIFSVQTTKAPKHRISILLKVQARTFIAHADSEPFFLPWLTTRPGDSFFVIVTKQTLSQVERKTLTKQAKVEGMFLHQDSGIHTKNCYFGFAQRKMHYCKQADI
jgi:hypothetical protein